MGEIVLRADVIAKTEPLTEETLLKEIFGFQNNTFRLRKKKKYVLKQLKDIYEYMEEGSKQIVMRQFVIYCFIRLWNEHVVYDYNFKDAWEKNRSMISISWTVSYLRNNITEIQQSFVVV